MKKIYVDLTRDCMGIIVHEAEVIPVGTLVHSEPEQYRDSELALRFLRMGLHFWFGAAPEPDLYTIPQTTILAHDGGAGRFLTTEEGLYFLDGQGQCFRIGNELRDLADNWRETMIPTGEITVFHSRAEAEKLHRIYCVQEVLEEFK